MKEEKEGLSKRLGGFFVGCSPEGLFVLVMAAFLIKRKGLVLSLRRVKSKA